MTRPSDLRTRPCLVHTGVERTVWTFGHADELVRVPVTGRVRADQSEALRQFAVDGLGFALLAAWLVRDDLEAGGLVTHLADWSTTPAPIRAVLPPGRAVPARVRALLTHIETAWSEGLAAPTG